MTDKEMLTTMLENCGLLVEEHINSIRCNDQ